MLNARLDVGERHTDPPSAALRRLSGSGVIDENATHLLGGERKEVRPVARPDVYAEQAQVGFVDEGGRLQGVIHSLASKVGRRNPSQFCVDEPDHLRFRGLVALLHGLQEGGEFAFGREFWKDGHRCRGQRTLARHEPDVMTDGAPEPLTAMQWRRLKDLFDELTDLPGEARQARLQVIARDEPALAELERLLTADAIRSSGAGRPGCRSVRRPRGRGVRRPPCRRP